MDTFSVTAPRLQSRSDGTGVAHCSIRMLVARARFGACGWKRSPQRRSWRRSDERVARAVLARGGEWPPSGAGDARRGGRHDAEETGIDNVGCRGRLATRLGDDRWMR